MNLPASLAPTRPKRPVTRLLKAAGRGHPTGRGRLLISLQRFLARVTGALPKRAGSSKAPAPAERDAPERRGRAVAAAARTIRSNRERVTSRARRQVARSRRQVARGR
jgi:hypothetical protein